MAIVRKTKAEVKDAKFTPEELARLDAKTDAELTAAAESDPDNPPITAEEFARMHRPGQRKSGTTVKLSTLSELDAYVNGLIAADSVLRLANGSAGAHNLLSLVHTTYSALWLHRDAMGVLLRNHVASGIEWISKSGTTYVISYRSGEIRIHRPSAYGNVLVRVLNAGTPTSEIGTIVKGL